MIKTFLRTILLYVILLWMMSIVLMINAEAAEVTVGAAPGEEFIEATDSPQDAVKAAETQKTAKNEKNNVTKRPQSEKLDKYLHPDLQEYIWGLCKERYEGEELKQYYAFMIGLAEGESTFKANRTNYHNSDGTYDRGMFQINDVNYKELKKQGLITCQDDLYDAATSAKCADYILQKGYKGYSEQSYTWYLYGIRRYKSNKYTQRVWKIIQSWYTELWG